MGSVRAVHCQHPQAGLCRPSGIKSTCLSGTIFGCTDVDLLVQTRTDLEPRIFVTEGLVSLSVELHYNQLQAVKDRGT